MISYISFLEDKLSLWSKEFLGSPLSSNEFFCNCDMDMEPLKESMFFSSSMKPLEGLT